VHDEAALLANEEDQFVGGKAPFAVETAGLLLKFLAAAAAGCLDSASTDRSRETSEKRCLKDTSGREN
jgi:hypothetical protein